MPQFLTSSTEEGTPLLEEPWAEDKVKSMTEIWARLEKHEAECALRYQRLDEKLCDQRTAMKALDLKIWGLAILIIVAPMVHKFLA